MGREIDSIGNEREKKGEEDREIGWEDRGGRGLGEIPLDLF